MFFNENHRVETVQSAEELADKLVEVVDKVAHARSHCLCTGYYYRGYLWLNDSRVPDANNIFQEWGVIQSAQMFIHDMALQVESITISFFKSRDRLIETIKAVSAGAYDSSGLFTFVHTQSPEAHGSCDHCR